MALASSNRFNVFMHESQARAHWQPSLLLPKEKGEMGRQCFQTHSELISPRRF